MKKVTALIMVLVMAFALAACSSGGGGAETTKAAGGGETTAAPAETTTAAAPGGGEETPAAEPTEEETEDISHIDKTLIIGIGTSAPSMGWKEGTGANLGNWCMSLLRMQYPIYRIVDPVTLESTYYYVLIKGWEQVDDDTYDVEIREGIYDSEGNDITVDDFVATLEYYKINNSNPTINLLESVEKVDETHFRCHLNGNQKAGDWEDIMAVPPIVDSAVIERDGDAAVTGTTGFVLDRFENGAICRFVKAENGYWNEKANETKDPADGYCPVFDYADIDAIEFQVITDTAAMALALENGDIDIAIGLADNDAITLGGTGEFNVASRPDNMLVLTMNASQSALTGNENLRKAILYGVDSEGIAQMAYGGNADILKAWSHPSYDDYNPAWDSADYFEYDPAKAKEYLDKFFAETGTTAATLNLRLVTQTGGVYNKAAQAVQSYIVDLVGNDTCVTIESYDRGSFNGIMTQPENFEMLLLPCQSTTRSTSVYNYNYYLDLNRNATEIFHADDSELQPLLDAAGGVKTNSVDTVDKFQQHLNDKAYCKGLVCGVTFNGAAKWITNIEQLAGPKNTVNYGALHFDWANSGKPEK